VRFMTPLERWTRRASGYLASPDRADDLPVRTALIPIARGKRRWGLSVHVSVDPEVLTFMPYGEHYRGDWRVAALVTRNDDGASWQMFTTAQLSASGAAARFPAILHTRSLARLKPGDYRLAAVVEDRNNNLLGATETSLVVASGRSGASAIGPILLRERPRVVRLYLPMVGETKALPRGTGPGAGLLPLDPSSIHPGDSLYAATWLCDNENRPTAQAREEQYIRYVAREGVPAFQLPAIAPVPALECVRVDDVIDTTDLEPGNFSYHLRSADSATAHEDANVDLQATFTVKPLPSEPTQTASPD